MSFKYLVNNLFIRMRWRALLKTGNCRLGIMISSRLFLFFCFLIGPDAVRAGNGSHVVSVLSECREPGRSDQVNRKK